MSYEGNALNDEPQHQQEETIEEDKWVTVSPKSEPVQQSLEAHASVEIEDQQPLDIIKPRTPSEQASARVVTAQEYVESTPQAEPEEVIPLLYEMSDIVQRKVPALAFNGHLYSNVSSARQVSINGRKLREGDWLKDLQLLEITRDGAVFEIDSHKFKLLF